MHIHHCNTIIELPQGSTAYDLAQKLHLTAPHQALSAWINGTMRDLSAPLTEGDEVRFVDFDTPEGKEVFWHTSAHVLAQAVLRLYPDAKPTIGPPIEQGFYYDFGNLSLSDQDLARIEKEMADIVAQNYPCHREVLGGKQDALQRFADNKYKCELIQGFPDAELTGYRQGEFFDLCRGPHLPSLGKIKALKLLKLSGAYWKGDQKNEMLTRIYGITFPDRKLLKDYLHLLQEAKRRDHKIIGPNLDLFSLKEEAPGMPFIHPKGMVVWNHLLAYWRLCHEKAGYVEIKTPHLMTKELWEVSGHWHNYRHNMYDLKIDEREFAIKPMNCPGGMLFYKSGVHSYRSLPMRVAEIGLVHRYEASGALSGLFRVRSFHQDDAHIYMQPEQIRSEIIGVLQLLDEIYSTFGLSYHLELSTKPESNTIGGDQEWEIATNGLRQALESIQRPYRINEGDGAFYGPKIDAHIRDALGRTWQCGTIQLDFALPEKFGLEYVAADGSRPRPVMLHRALFGSIERFFGILIEHYAGRFPLWISPLQVRVLTVADRHIPTAAGILKQLKEAGLRADLDDSKESVGKKVRQAQMEQINYMLTIGDKEMETGRISLRTREGYVQDEELPRFIEKILVEDRKRSLRPSYEKD